MILRDDSQALSLGRQFASARGALAGESFPTLARRRAHLRAVERLIETHATEIAQAVSADFGHRPAQETRLLEIFPTLGAARYAHRHVAKWMAPRRIAVAPHFAGAQAWVQWQPAGVVGIVVPWNYPLLLAFGPLIAALAAGNRVLIKMSELSPHSAELFARIVRTAFADNHVSFVAGSRELGKAFAALPFDHLLFTGSSETGRSVMRAAALNLTPVTLELGGKSPAIVGPDAPLETAAARIMSGKCRNAGQTCIAPDYVLLPAGKTDAFVSAARRIVGERYPALPDSPDFASIISAAHAERLASLLADATAKGATIVPLHACFAHPERATRRFPPLIVVDVREDMRIMHEEIFGPILPVRTYHTLTEAIDYVNARPTPLALYYFGATSAEIELVLGRTKSGGACINDVMLQFAEEALPFGGSGASGMGAYHGQAGFETFSHRKAVFKQAKRTALGLLEPPYGRRFDALLRFLRS